MNAPTSACSRRESALASRVAQVDALRKASDGASARPLADVVRDNLHHLWQHDGRIGETRPGRRPESIYLRRHFILATAADARGPALARLIQSRGLQLRFELLLLFDAQCRYAPNSVARNVRPVAPDADAEYESWRQLILAPTMPTRGTGRGPGDLRARQITEALMALERQHLVWLPRDSRGTRRRYDGLRLLSETSTPEQQPWYKIPKGGAGISPHFFTNLWIFALTDAEIATYLLLCFLRHLFTRKHATQGVFLTAEDREKYFRIRRSTWRSAEMLHRFRLIDRMPSTGRSYRTGNVGDFHRKWASREVRPVLFTINDQALQRPALETIHQVLTAPTEEDQRRRQGKQEPDL